MTPEERQMLLELYAWMQARQRQQLSFPVDEASRFALGVPTDRGVGAGSTTQTVNVPSGGGNITVPSTPSGFRILETDGGRFLIPHHGTV